MTPRNKISFACFLLIASGEFLIAGRFLSASQIMDYHLTAMGSSWEQLSPGIQVMSLNFLRSAGLGFLLAGSAISAILLSPFRKGEAWARWTLLFICTIQALVMIFIVSQVRAATPAVPPMGPFAMSLTLTVVGFFTFQAPAGKTAEDTP
ncbi:hypothetical protein [Desulfogranum mediterraneum]|uniref:hypothetical protein n=1 Tax=Desulfogranum mediterraneum TaxID=160661 RepID=UPI0003FB3297|nr:hypothetical protein [Desulfogranum mediterraneum]